MITRICRHCHATYQTFPSIKKDFCSQSCADVGRRTGEWIACGHCGQPVYSRPARPRLFCGKSCARAAANRTSSNPAYTRDISGANNPMYGKRRLGPDNPMYGRRKEQAPRWTGGRKVRRDGYVFAVAPDDHPHPADVKSGLKYVLEHRLIMEQHLGRYLTPREVVHHRDGNKSNNSLENLELFGSQQEHIRLRHGGGL